MNGGQVGSRGYLLQTLIAILDLLNDLGKIRSIRMEPATDEDKTDFLVEYVDGRKKAVQVKSSQNQIGLPAVKRWATKLKDDLAADEYELCLIGPVSGELTKVTEVDGVALPVPRSLDILGLIQQASHRLDVFLTNNLMSAVPPTLRELIVDGLIGRLTAFSTAGTAISGSELLATVKEWLLHVYPGAVQKALNEQVEFICDSFTLAAKAEGDNQKVSLLFPFTIINDGLRPVVVEWMAVRLVADTGSWVYTPVLTVDYTAFIQKNVGIDNSVALTTFRPFVVRKSDAIDVAILFGPKAGQPTPEYDKWNDQYFDVTVFAKLRGVDTALAVFSMQQTIPAVALEQYFMLRKSATLMRRAIDI